ncbi:MAG: hypothetical protein [Caudoviricetes sp.]|nr:MAG: hypothetical protein [Caudoviricetes sp.]
MEKKYIQTDELHEYLDWDNLMKMDRYAGGHDCQMKGLFKNVEIIAHFNEGGYEGMVATCVKFNDGKFKDKFAIYNDYYGSCSGCDAWEDATDEEVKNMCIGLSNQCYLFDKLDDVKDFLKNHKKDNNWFSSWNSTNLSLLNNIEKNIID